MMTRRVTVAEAALIAHRKPRTIYDWIAQGLLEEFQGEAGEILVDGVLVLVVEETRRRGRPRNAAKSANSAL
jgi:hypothetical protein